MSSKRQDRHNPESSSKESLSTISEKEEGMQWGREGHKEDPRQIEPSGSDKNLSARRDEEQDADATTKQVSRDNPYEELLSWEKEESLASMENSDADHGAAADAHSAGSTSSESHHRVHFAELARVTSPLLMTHFDGTFSVPLPTMEKLEVTAKEVDEKALEMQAESNQSHAKPEPALAPSRSRFSGKGYLNSLLTIMPCTSLAHMAKSRGTSSHKPFHPSPSYTLPTYDDFSVRHNRFSFARMAEASLDRIDNLYTEDV